jgi:hypothetical protein
MPTPRPTERRGPVGALARLDRRVVPALQRGSRRLVRGLSWPLRAVARLEDRAAPRLVRLGMRSWRGVALAAALIATLGSAVHLQRYPDVRDARRQAAAGQPGEPRSVSGGEPADAGTGASDPVGPAVGEDAEEYVASRREALEALRGADERLAVVSFSDYRTAEDVAALLPAELVVHLVQYRLPTEGARPLQAEVTGDELTDVVGRAVDDAVEDILAEIDELRTLLESDTIDDPDAEADFERRLSELQAVRNLLDATPAVVFAVVIEGPVSALTELARRDDVRLVDPAPEGADATASAFYGLLPEEREEVSFGTAG